MIKRGCIVVAIGVALFLFVIPACFYLVLPKTPEGRFRWTTGIKLPPGATLVDQNRDYTVGMRDSFGSEGTSLLVFFVDKKTAADIINSPAPWNSKWERGPVPLHVNPNRPDGDSIFIAQTGDMGNGHMLAVDSENDQLWLFGWDW